METIQRIKELVIQRLETGLSSNEQAELHNWINQSDDNRKAIEAFLAEENLRSGLQDMYYSKNRIWQRLKGSMPEVNKTQVRSMNWRYMAAAAILLFFVGGYYLISNRSVKIKIAKTNNSSQIKNDVPAPTGTKTILTLANGSTIILDSVQNGTLAQQGNAKVQKLSNGQLAYNNNDNNALLSEKPTEIFYNTLSTAKGGQTMVVLSDGSKVWLNTASSIRFPTAFTGKERSVEITGEAYFEIAHNRSVPFIVKVKDADIKVLGTHFNVMAYDDENLLRTTLLEGSVMISRGNESNLLQPGQQAQVGAGETIRVVSDVDTDQVVAWKNGEFQFNMADIESVMRQLKRWYDIDVVYEGGGKPAIHLVGTVSRNVNLSNVLKLMELNGAHFRAEGKRITVLN